MCITCTRVSCTVRTNVSSPLGPPGSSVLAGVIALTHLRTQQYSDGQGKVVTMHSYGAQTCSHVCVYTGSHYI